MGKFKLNKLKQQNCLLMEDQIRKFNSQIDNYNQLNYKHKFVWTEHVRDYKQSQSITLLQPSTVLINLLSNDYIQNLFQILNVTRASRCSRNALQLLHLVKTRRVTETTVKFTDWTHKIKSYLDVTDLI